MVSNVVPFLNKTHYLEQECTVKLFSGRSNPELTKKIANFLGLEVSPLLIKNFSDGEIFVRVQESVRGQDVFIIQSTCSSVNDNLMELLITIDAFKRASAKTINVVMPYYGYARQDRKNHGREAITAKLAADLLETAGASRVIAMDLHTGQLQGFFNIKVDHLKAQPVLVDYFKRKNLINPVIVSPDAGGAERARQFAKNLNAPIAIIDKRRTDHNKAEVYNLIGDVTNRDVVILDDMIDTGGTICSGAKMLKNKGALNIYACASHPVFSGPAIERLSTALSENTFEEVVVTNSIPLSNEIKNNLGFIQLDVSSLLGEAIHRIYHDQSVSELFD